MPTIDNTTPRTPAPGDADHAAILAAVRATVRDVLHKPVTLDADTLRVLGQHAFMQATMRELDGRSLDYADTPLADDAAQGHRSDICMALLRRERDEWVPMVSQIGPTDLAWATWQDQYDVPDALFPAL